ncbi:MAG: hypothetical protein MJE77_14175 [Proteobacteria bacterium]|nr:hypothetical protein [Pseudomonadota bacterium]
MASDIARTAQSRAVTAATGGNHRGVEPAPWYRRWYAVAGFSAAIFMASAIAMGIAVDGIDADKRIDL